MKRTLAIVMAVLTMFLIAGCDMGSTATQKNSTQKGQQDTKNTQSSKAAARQAVVCELPGLGDTRTAWTAEWGSPTAQGDTIKLFNNGAYKTIFEGDKAITITFASKDGKNPLSEKMVPKDGKKLSENSKKTGDSKMIVQKWHSDLLAAAIPETKGNYTIMQHMEGTAYTNVTVDCTPNLSK